MKKIISFLLVLATVMSCLVLTVSANTPTGAVRSDEGLLPFEDVKDSHWFADAVEFCYSNEIIKGMNEYTFGFSGQLTRAQFVTMLANLEGADTSTYTVTQFPDVKSSHWYYGAVAWAYGKGIVSGMNDGTFAPNKALSRAELAVIMKNYMDGKYEVTVSDNVLDKFTDKPKAQYWYYEAMKYAVSAELLSGNSDGTLASTGTVTRAQAAVIFNSFMEKYFYGACEHTFSAADCTNAPTCTKCGLKNGLPNGHKVTGYTCEASTTCLECGAVVAPSNVYHNFLAATCTSPRTCTICGQKRGEAKGHSWKAATCTAPKTCSGCQMTEGYALGHNYSGNSCTRCGTASPRAKVIAAMKTKGTYISYANTYVYEIEEDGSYVGISYDATTGELALVYSGYTYGGGSDMTSLILPVSGTTCRFDYIYYTSSDSVLFDGYGYIEATTFNEDTTVSFYWYKTSANNPEVACSNASGEIDLMVTYADYMFNELCGVSIAEFGFNYYK